MIKGNENIKNFLSKDIVNSLNDFLNDNDYECGYDGNYTGIVVNNNDPDKVGKCRIRVYGVHSDNIQDIDLPWAFPDFNFRGGLKGSFVVPPVGCLVNVYFERGEIYIPRYSSKVINQNNLPTNKNRNYPNNMIFYETDNGDSFEIDRSVRETTLKHSSNTKFFMDETKALLEHFIGSKIQVDNEKMFFEHNTGHKVTMDNSKIEIKDNFGNEIELNATGIKIKSATTIDLEHGLMTKSNGRSVIPSGIGPFCSLPYCVITGLPQVGQQTV